MKWWYQHSLLAFLLWPLSLLFRLVVIIRRWWLIRHQIKVAVPLIIVGNITVGGAGKTPLVIYLAKALTEKGFKVAVISRGYHSHIDHYPYLVTANDSATKVGDEPLLIQRLTTVPVIIDPNRVRAAQRAKKLACDVIISDDGLQHYRLARDIEIAVIDGKRRFGNNRCLPAGPLREPLSRLATVDFCVTNGKPQDNEIAMTLKPTRLNNLTKHVHAVPVTELTGKTVHGVAGIGHPEQFFETLEQLGATVIRHSFADHHAFTKKDFAFADNEWVVMTEKDAVKCESFAEPNWWALAVEADIEASFVKRILAKL